MTYDFSSYSDYELSDHLANLISEDPTIVSSKNWMKACFQSWDESRSRGKLSWLAITFQLIAKETSKKTSWGPGIYSDWVAEDYQFLLDFLQIQDVKSWKKRHLASYNQLCKHDRGLPTDLRIGPKLSLNRYSVSFISTLSQDEVVRFIYSTCKNQPIDQIKKAHPQIMRAILFRSDIDQIAKRVGWAFKSETVLASLENAQAMATEIFAKYRSPLGNCRYPRYRSAISKYLRKAEQSDLRIEVLLLIPELDITGDLLKLSNDDIQRLLTRHGIHTKTQLKKEFPKLERFLERKSLLNTAIDRRSICNTQFNSETKVYRFQGAGASVAFP